MTNILITMVFLQYLFIYYSRANSRAGINIFISLFYFFFIEIMDLQFAGLVPHPQIMLVND